MHDVMANGASIPAIGLGTWDLRGDTATRMVADALAMGYRHIDTAQKYENEREVGAGIKAAQMKRGDIFVTTKIWPDRHQSSAFREAAKESLDNLGLDHVDLLLLHWPAKDVPMAEAIEALNWAKAAGVTKHIGVSNFTVAMIEEAARLSTAPLVCNQVEYHPYLLQDKVYPACRAKGMAMTAYCPIARGKVLSDPVIGGIAKAHGVSTSQVTLRWLIDQDGVIAIPRTSKPERAKENLTLDFKLSPAETAAIDALRSAKGRVVNVDVAPIWD